MTHDDVSQAPVLYLHGRSLACALGTDLAQALQGVQAWPCGDMLPDEPPSYRRIPDAHADPLDPALTLADAWYQRARALVCRAASEALADRDGILLLASASLDIGALESYEHWPSDGYAFAERVAGWLDWRGPVYVVSTACTSACNALRRAAACMAAGSAPSALVLGFELANQLTAGGFASLQLLSPSGHARPWAADRDGLVLGEAVAALHLRPTPTAPAGTVARWCVRGSANVVDGQDASGVNPQAVRAAVEQALVQAGIAAASIDLIKLHAAGGLRSDALEWQALGQVFARPPARITLKHLCGHALGASAAAEIALLTASLDAGLWPAQTMAQVDAQRAAAASPAADLTLDAVDAQLSTQRPGRLRHVLALFLGFGGGHTALILEDMHATA